MIAFATTVLALATTIATAPGASAALTAVGPVDPTTNFPSWYQDANGLQLQPCLSGPPICFAAPGDLVAPDGEVFYNHATASVGDANIVLALEGAYAGPGNGQEVTFSRIRFFNKLGLTAGAKYTVTHPYGTDTYTADVNGSILMKNATQDIGCAGAPCTFASAMTSRLGPFITWDTFGKTPALGGPPVGYVGDNVTAHPIAPVFNGVDYFRVEGPGINKTGANYCPARDGDTGCIQTNDFIVEGKVIAGPSSAVTPAAVDFGHQQVGTSSTGQTITVASRGASDLLVGPLALAGTNPGDYALAGDTCSNATVAPGSTCTVDVRFTPTAARASSATLTVPDNTPAGSHVITLKGTTAPAATLDSAGLAFPSQKVGTKGVPQVVNVSNTGSADLVINAPTVTGTGAASYQVTANTCTVAIAPGGSCDVSVTFAPTTTGNRTATLNISDNGPSTHPVSLTGAGTAPTQNPSRTSVAFTDQATGSTSGQQFITVTNGGTANLVMQSVAVSGLNAADFAVGTNTCATGFNVVPGDSCTVGVSFSPKAAGGRNATLTITGDAGADSLPLSGNGVAPPDSLAPSTPGTPAVRASGANGLVVTWAASTDNVGVDHYDVFRDGSTVAIAHPSTATFTDTALAEASTHRYTVKAVDAAGNTSAASLSGSGTTADLTAPTQTHNPAGGATAVSTASTVTATFNESVQGVAGATFTLKNPAGTTVAATVGYNATTRVATLTPSAALAANTVYTAALTGGPTAIRDVSGNPLASASWTFTTGTATDATKPALSTRTPGVAATGVAIGTTTARTPVTATFSEAVTGVTGTTLTLKQGTTAVAAAVTYNATTHVATLTPSAPLVTDKTYTVGLTAGIKDVAGNTLTATSWTFITGPRPTLTARTPGVGATGVAVGTTTARTPVTTTFSEAVTGVSGTTVTLKQGTTAVAAAVTYNATTHVATLTPSAPLVADKTYTVGLTAGIKDVAGNPITATTWTFITGPRPTLTARTPAVNALNVGRTANVTATFSEAITGSSTGTVTLKNTTTGVVQTAVVSYNTTTRVVTLNPSATLAANTKFTVALTAGLKDAAGNPITATTWTFTTGAA